MNEANDHREPGGEKKPDTETAQSAAASVAAMIGTRNLKIIIVAMPFVFLIVVAAIIAVFGRPDGPAKAAASTAPPQEIAIAEASIAQLNQKLSVNGSGGITLPEDAAIGSMAFDGDRLAVHVHLQDGAMIVIYDLENNIVVQTVPIGRGE